MIQKGAKGLFSVLFPSEFRICGLPVLNISRLPVCSDCLAGIHPVRGRVCSICEERVLSSYVENDSDGIIRCPLCRRIDHLFLRAVAYVSYDGALRELIHLMKYTSMRPAPNLLGSMLAEAVDQLKSEFGPHPYSNGMRESIAARRGQQGVGRYRSAYVEIGI